MSTDESKLLTTTSPHIRDRTDIPRIMWTVNVALLPALFAACFFFGWPAIRTVLIAVVAAVATEALVQALARRPITVSDGSAVVTGLLVAFVLPSNVPWFVPLVASVFAIAVVKQAFGGLGCNIWNPALAGRAFVVACFAGLTIGGWQGTPADPDATPPVPGRPANWVFVSKGLRPDAARYRRVDAMTRASALSAQKDWLRTVNTTAAELAKSRAAKAAPDGRRDVSALSAAQRCKLAETLGSSPRDTLRKVRTANNTGYLDLLIGAQVGCVGETSALALLLGGALLLVTGIIRWHIPVAFLGTVALFGWLLPESSWAYHPEAGLLWRGMVWGAGDPLFHVLAGGAMLGAIFMATDMVTSPLSRAGQLIFGVGCGVLTVIIRKYGGYPEGVCYSILLMNTATPLIDALTRPRVYGKKKR